MAGHEPIPYHPASSLPPLPPTPGAQARVDKLAEVALYTAVEHSGNWADATGVPATIDDVLNCADRFLAWLRAQK